MSHMDVIAAAPGRDERSIGERFLDRLAHVKWRQHLRQSGEEFVTALTADGVLRALQHTPMPHTLAGFAVMIAEVATPVAAHIVVKGSEAVLPLLADGTIRLAETGAREVKTNGIRLAHRLQDLLNQPGHPRNGCTGAHCTA